ncbi:hypothetical protein [Serratia grimesii]|nr:hypothetical protein [Serratia grimesii]
MVNLNSRIQHKYDLNGSDFATKHRSKHVFYLTVLFLCLLAVGAVWN